MPDGRDAVSQDDAPGRRVIAHAIVTLCYGTAWLLARVGRRARSRATTRPPCIVVIGTFHNPNWLLAHIVPLAQSGAAQVVVVTDHPQAALNNVRFVCPPPWLARAVGRSLGKLVALVRCVVCEVPDLLIGYALCPNAAIALAVARIVGRPACYQVTGGPSEIAGGGVGAENPILNRLGRPSVFLEWLALAVVREFDLLVVRGSQARSFLIHHGVDSEKIVVITGAVRPHPDPDVTERIFDMVFVGRLTEVKQPVQFVEIAAAVREQVPTLRAAMVGDGPLRARVEQRAAELGLADSLALLGQRVDVENILAQSRIFVLTSHSEGLSIAMAEAMAAGAVPVVAAVGELGELVTSGVSGYLVTPNRIDEYTERIVGLLRDPATRARRARAAVAVAMARTGVEVVTAEWARTLRSLINIRTRPVVRSPSE
jgi:L-malate glycosyltransferase